MNDNNNSLSPSPFSVPGTVLGALHVLMVTRTLWMKNQVQRG